MTVDGEIVGEIENGLVVLLGIAHDDTKQDADYLAPKIVALRIFDDTEGRMNVSVKEIDGGLADRFSVHFVWRRATRFAALVERRGRPGNGRTLYDYFVESSRKLIARVATGSFRKMMQVELVNDGPVTILLDSRKTVLDQILPEAFEFSSSSKPIAIALLDLVDKLELFIVFVTHAHRRCVFFDERLIRSRIIPGDGF